MNLCFGTNMAGFCSDSHKYVLICLRAENYLSHWAALTTTVIVTWKCLSNVGKVLISGSTSAITSQGFYFLLIHSCTECLIQKSF